MEPRQRLNPLLTNLLIEDIGIFDTYSSNVIHLNHSGTCANQQILTLLRKCQTTRLTNSLYRYSFQSRTCLSIPDSEITVWTKRYQFSRADSKSDNRNFRHFVLNVGSYRTSSNALWKFDTKKSWILGCWKVEIPFFKNGFLNKAGIFILSCLPDKYKNFLFKWVH